MTPPRNCRKTLVGASIARPCPFALQENRPGKCVAAVSWRATNGRPYTRNKAGMQFFDGLRSGQDRSLQLLRQRCGGYNKVGGNKKSHHGRWWENVFLASLAASHRRNRIHGFSICSRLIVDALFGVCRIFIGQTRNLSFGNRNRSNCTINFCQTLNGRCKCFRSGRCACKASRCYTPSCQRSRRTIIFRNDSLRSHYCLTRFGNNLFFIGFVDVSRQCRNQQSGQDGQDDQNDDQLDEGEALFVFQFFEYLVFLQFCLCADASRPHRHFIL